MFEGNIINLRPALEQFRQFIANAKPRPTRIWSKDPDFDVVILKHAMQQMDMMWPFQFWESRSVRTIMELAYPPGGLKGDFPTIGTGVAHDAVDDSIRQVLAVQHSHKVLDA
jgi:inhibitor of KinA sporulation pathway (predicted exonuclease)